MSLITNIMGWIEIEQFNNGRKYNVEVLNDLRNIIKNEKYDGFLIDMFCIPRDCGNKEPGYIMFGASINHSFFSMWLKDFEEFIKKLEWFNAFVFCEESDGSEVYTIGYYKTEEGFSKVIIEFGESTDYENWSTGDKFPVLFNILKSIVSGNTLNSRISHRTTYHKVLKHGEIITKSNNDVYEFNKKDFDIVTNENTVKLIKRINNEKHLTIS